MPYSPEPPHTHGQPARTGVLIVNLGTPAAPTAAAVRPYLAEFLADPRVVEIPRLLWLPILHGIILRARPGKSAAKYASIWRAEGSPLAHFTRQLALGLQARLGSELVVRAAMRYGEPSVAAELDELKRQGCQRVLVLPLYPQYSGTTTASVFDAVASWVHRTRLVPELRQVARYHDEPRYIAALAASVRAHWQRLGRQGHLLMSFHGVPQRTLDLGDPYYCECHKTGRLLAEALGLAEGQWTLSFQSRFGRARWLEPATDATAQALARRGEQVLDVVCPGFATDCLETLEEIAMEVKQSFLAAGGRAFDYIACLNDSAEGVEALATVIERHTAGWAGPAPDGAALAASARRAVALGAPR